MTNHSMEVRYYYPSRGVRPCVYESLQVLVHWPGHVVTWHQCTELIVIRTSSAALRTHQDMRYVRWWWEWLLLLGSWQSLHRVLHRVLPNTTIHPSKLWYLDLARVTVHRRCRGNHRFSVRAKTGRAGWGGVVCSQPLGIVQIWQRDAWWLSRASEHVQYILPLSIVTVGVSSKVCFINGATPIGGGRGRRHKAIGIIQFSSWYIQRLNGYSNSTDSKTVLLVRVWYGMGTEACGHTVEREGSNEYLFIEIFVYE